MEFNNTELSVIVQGAIIPEKTKIVLDKIRSFLPGASIILSTWKNENVDDLHFDKLVLSDDPGAEFDCFTKNPDGSTKPNNMNRQITSTRNGLLAAETKYSLKFRTDFILTSSHLVDFYKKTANIFTQRIKKFSLFEERVLVFGVGNPHTMGLAYHLSDYVQLGLTKDLLELWDIPFLEKKDATYCTDNEIYHYPHFFNFRYACEQKLWLDNIKKLNIDINTPEIYFDNNEKITSDSEITLINNFIFIDYDMTGIESKFSWMNDPQNNFGYTFKDFYLLYGNYFGHNNATIKFYKRYRLNKLGRKSYLKSLLKDIIRKNQTTYKAALKIHSYIKKNSSSKLATEKTSNKIEWIDDAGNVIEVKSIINFDITMHGNNNTVRIFSRCPTINNTIFIDGNNNSITIGRNAHFIGNTTIFVGNRYNNRKLNIGDNAMIMGARIFIEEDEGSIDIGSNLTCSDEVLIQNSDGHVIYSNENGEIMNAGTKGIRIEDNVWLARRSTILKNSKVSYGSIVATGAVVSRQHEDKHVVLGGVPAKVIKKNVHWTRDMFNDYKKRS